MVDSGNREDSLIRVENQGGRQFRAWQEILLISQSETTVATVAVMVAATMTSFERNFCSKAKRSMAVAGTLRP